LRFFLPFLAAAGLLVSLGAAADDYGLPSIGQPADNALSPVQEKKIGREVVAQLLAAGAISDDPELTEYVNRIGRRLATHSSHAPSHFNFYLINDDSVNAFALPGGYIGLNAGLLLESTNESQVAGVLAHEIAHVTQRHIARQIEATQGMTLLTAAAMLLAVIAGGGNPAVIQAAVTMGVAGIGQQQINFTRAHELEADRLGIATLAQSNYDPNGMAGFFGRMERRSRLYGNRIPEILLTHPISTTRIAEAESRARNFPVRPISEYDDYGLMRARARVHSSEQPSDVVRYFHEQQKSQPDSVAIQYGYALALGRTGQQTRAVEMLRQLHESDTGNVHYALALSDMRGRNGDVDGALTTLKPLVPRYPNYAPLNIAYAQALIDIGRPAEARAYLLNDTQLVGQDFQAHELLARAADAQDHDAEAYYRQAEYHHMRGEYAAAIYKLRTGLRLPDLNGEDAQRMQASLARYKRECALAWSAEECRDRVEGTVRR